MGKSKIISKISSSVMLVGLLLITQNVYGANDKYSTTLDTKAQAERKSEIVVEVGINDISIESGEKGIGAYIGKIEYDPNVLEYKTTNESANWEAPLFQNGLIIGNTKSGEVEKNDQSIGSITFTVKKDAPLGNTTIKVENFSGSTGVTDISSTNNESIEVNIVEASGNEENPGENDPGKGDSNQNGNQNDEIANNGDSEVEVGSKTGILPKLGANKTLMYVILTVSILGLVIGVVLIQRKVNKRINT